MSAGAMSVQDAMVIVLAYEIHIIDYKIHRQLYQQAKAVLKDRADKLIKEYTP